MNRPLLLALLLSLPGLAHADIYRWVDAQGRVHYTQTPPPDSQAQKLTPRGVAAPADPGSGVSDIGKTAEAFDRERAAAATQKAEAEEQARARGLRCAQAQSRLKLLDERGPNRIATKNEKGEYERWTMEQHDAERATVMKVIQESCRG